MKYKQLNRNEEFIEFFKTFNKTSCAQTLSKTPEDFFERYNFNDMKFLIGTTYTETKINIYRYVYGIGICAWCGNEVHTLQGWSRGWNKTCSLKCERNIASERQKGDNNTSLSMTKESKAKWILNISNTHKKNIEQGKYTPKSSNYRHHTPIHFKFNDEYIIARSSWEVVYKLQNPTFLYEKIRIRYYDTKKSEWRIYIPDFYDSCSNTIIEIKPEAYINQIEDKKKGVIDNGYNFTLITENYFMSNMNPNIMNILEKSVIEYDKVKHRFNWVKKCLK